MIIWSCFLFCTSLNDDISRCLFHFFYILVLRFVKGEGDKKHKMTQNEKKFCLAWYFKNCTPSDYGFWYTCVKWYLQQTFSFFQKSVFSGFSKFINKCQKEILQCTAPFSYVCNFIVKLWLILSQLELLRAELPKCNPNILIENCGHTICPVLSILFYMPSQ